MLQTETWRQDGIKLSKVDQCKGGIGNILVIIYYKTWDRSGQGSRRGFRGKSRDNSRTVTCGYG